jgi:hypothetical protein
MIGQAYQAGQIQDALNLILLHFESQLRRQRRRPIGARKIDRNNRFSILPVQCPLNKRPFFGECRDELELLFRVSRVAMEG